MLIHSLIIAGSAFIIQSTDLLSLILGIMAIISNPNGCVCVGMSLCVCLCVGGRETERQKEWEIFENIEVI